MTSAAPDLHIHALLAARAKAGLETFILQIGAMDGHSGGDPVHAALMENDWRALLVEPIPHYFEKLKSTYAGRPRVRFANTAIAEHEGETEMLRLNPAAIEAGDVPRWGHGASSLYADRTALEWEALQAHIRRETVPCTTLPALIEAHGINRIDVLQIDAEGHDYHILRQLDFGAYRPAIINLEIVNLPEEEQEATRALLDRHRYVYRKTGYDLVGVAG